MGTTAKVSMLRHATHAQARVREGGNHKIKVLGPNVAMDGSDGERAVRAITVANTEPNETVLAHAERVGELADAGEEAGGKGLVKEHTREIMTDNAPRMVAIWRGSGEMQLE